MQIQWTRIHSSGSARASARRLQRRSVAILPLSRQVVSTFSYRPANRACVTKNIFYQIQCHLQWRKEVSGLFWLIVRFTIESFRQCVDIQPSFAVCWCRILAPCLLFMQCHKVHLCVICVLQYRKHSCIAKFVKRLRVKCLFVKKYKTTSYNYNIRLFNK